MEGCPVVGGAIEDELVRARRGRRIAVDRRAARQRLLAAAVGVDGGEPGDGIDTFSITTGTGYSAAGPLTSGNVQVHSD
jgi:hypothetical protein